MNNRVTDETTALPQAGIRPKRRRSWAYAWMIPVLAALLATWLLVDAMQQRGPLINLRFKQGHGLKPGDTLRYRGIRTGTVEQVTLDDDLGGIHVQLRLLPAATDLARTGSQFWIVRPRLDIAGVSGLDTVVGAKYLGVLPGDGEPRKEFLGLDQPPPAEAIEPGGLDIVLTAPGRGNLRPGAPISYRQVIVGTVIAVDLAKDASAVEARAYIKPRYTNLLRSNVRFWRAGGARVSAGLSGVSLALDSVPSLILGSINLAIPPAPGSRAKPGHRYTLYDEPRTQWLDWVPGLSLYDDASVASGPSMVRLSIYYRYRNWLYLTRDGERRAWLLPIDAGLLGPADVLRAPEEALANSVRMSLDGEPLAPPKPALSLGGGLALLEIDHGLPTWPATRARFDGNPENSLIIAGGDTPPRFVAAERVFGKAAASAWSLDPALPFDSSWHGATVVAERDGALLGLLLVNDGGAAVARAPDIVGASPAD